MTLVVKINVPGLYLCNDLGWILQAAAQGGLQHDRLLRLLDHLQTAVPPCMSEAADWESVDGWLDDLVPAYESLPLPGIPDPSMYLACI